jgi:dolichyl-phosphate beta-glucosyltransferase
MASVFKLIVRSLFLLPYTDTQCGAKLFTRKAAKIIVNETKLSQWAFDVELLFRLKQNNIIVEQVRTDWEDIDGSKISMIKSPIQMILAISQLRVTESRFKRLLRPIKPLISWLYKITK